MKTNQVGYSASFKLFLGILLSACFLATAAQADPLFMGTFKLTNEVHWGKAVLPAGDYSLTVDSTTDNTMFTIVRSADGKKAAFAMATTGARPEPGGSYIFVTDDGTRRVRLLNLPELNLSLVFGPLTKGEREVLYATKTRVVPVEVAAK
jgi:hypothetical protein